MVFPGNEDLLNSLCESCLIKGFQPKGGSADLVENLLRDVLCCTAAAFFPLFTAINTLHVANSQAFPHY